MHYDALAAKGIIRSPITSCNTRDHSVAAAFAENGIGREGGDGSAQRGRSVIYDCLVLPVFPFTDFSTSLNRFCETLPQDVVCSEVDYFLWVFIMLPPKIFRGENPNFR